ncbi:SAM-dependent methyltransferase [Actinomadura hibisca]|uniref:SAM-dependent methyltransferase n=1 Tax=Actinomadura hibisca TaxID=68565 RepID=UPI0008328572|nr:SAM-dependent methyltransferase [Actinomadura hibisca]
MLQAAPEELLSAPLPEIPGFDPFTAQYARAIDALRRGKDNFDADRALADVLLRAYPQMPDLLRVERRFHERAVRRVVRRGLTQLIDLAPLLPRPGQAVTHDLVRKCRVVYVANCPMVASYIRARNGLNSAVRVVDGDLNDPASILCSHEIKSLIDWKQPVAVLATGGVLDQMPNPAVLAPIRDLLAPGSHLVISHHHAVPDLAPAAQILTRAFPGWTRRDRDQIFALLDGLDVEEPGLRRAVDWPRRQATPADRALPVLAGIATKPQNADRT